MENARYQRLRAYMITNDLRWHHIGLLLGITQFGAMSALKGKSIKEKHYVKLCEFGFPKDLIPPLRKSEDSKILAKIEQINKTFDSEQVNAK